MHLRSGKTTDWWSEIHVNPQQDLRFRQVFFAAQVSSKFPPELSASMSRDLGYGYEGETPDGKSFKDWVQTPRRSVLKVGEKESYKEFFKWWINLWADGYEEELTADGVDERLAMLVFDASMKIRKMLIDEQILRFLEEFWRLWTYDKMREIIVVDRSNLARRTAHLRALLEELQAYRDDAMGDLVWPDENRKEDAEQSEAWRQRVAAKKAAAEL